MLFKTEGVNIVTGKYNSRQDGYRVTLTIYMDDGSITFRAKGKDDDKWMIVSGSNLSVAGMEKIAEAASYLIASACMPWFKEALAELKAEESRQTDAGYERMANGGI